MDIWSKVLTTAPHLPSTTRNSWPGPAANIMPLPLVAGTIWTGMRPQEEARLLVPTTGFLPQPRSVPEEVGTQCQDGRVARPYRNEKGSKDLTYHPVLRLLDLACDSLPL